jgi:hypothetical protein
MLVGLARACTTHRLAGHVEVLEKYGPFKANTAVNPCMRTPPGVDVLKMMKRAKTPEARAKAMRETMLMCPVWGFLVGRYIGGRAGCPSGS